MSVSTRKETAANAEKYQEFKLGPKEELRFEVQDTKDQFLTAILVGGEAEVFGTEMVIGKEYRFRSSTKMAIFTFKGCTIVVKGILEAAYVSKQTPMVAYLNIHASLETMRSTAEAKANRGPIVAIVGPTDVGKSTLCRLLLNYAACLGRRPIFVDVDVGQGNISVPGTLSALPIERPAEIESGFLEEGALVYFFGHTSPNTNIILYNALVSKLAENVQKRMENYRKEAVSGAIINTCGWVRSDGYQCIKHIVQCFKVDVMIVVDHERLFIELKKDMPSSVQVNYLRKNGGVVEKSSLQRHEYRENRIREYFYGHPFTQRLHPHSFQVKFSDMKIFKIGLQEVPKSCIPLGLNMNTHRTQLVAVTPTATALLHRLLAVSFVNDDSAVVTNVAGFVCVTDVDLIKGEMTVLSPQSAPLPKKVLLLSDIKFFD